MKNLGVFKDFTDNSIKSVYEIEKNKIIEMTLLQNKKDKDVICVPTHYLCCLKCKTCRLSSDKIEPIKINEFINALIESLKVQNINKKRTDKNKLIIIFNGIGEPLLNLQLVEETIKHANIIKENLGYEDITYELNTMIPNSRLINELKKIITEGNVFLKINFNLQASNNMLRKRLLPSVEEPIDDILKSLEKYQSEYGENSVDVEYSLIKGINDRDLDLINMINLFKNSSIQIKLVPFKPVNGMIPSNEETKLEWIQGLSKNNCKVEVKETLGKNIDMNYTKYFYKKDALTLNEKEKFERWKNLYQIFESQKRDNLSWDEYFMCVAKLTAMRSKDPNTQVGAVIVSKDNRILSIGYNGSPNGYNDERFPWKREGNKLDTKYLFVVHAERNAILNYLGNRKDFLGARIYVDLFPCNECAKEIIQSGIKEVVYLSDKYKDSEETIASKRLFDICGVSYRHFSNEREVTLKLSK